MSSGSVRTFRSQRTLPTSSTTQTAVSSTETSKPTKCAIAAAPSQMLEVRPIPDPIIVCEGAARSSLEGLGAAAAIHHLSTLYVSKAAIPLMMSWTALHPTCGNHRGLSGKESQDGDHYDDRVGYREVGVSGARDRCGGRSGGAAAPEPGPYPGVLREAAAMLGRDGGV